MSRWFEDWKLHGKQVCLRLVRQSRSIWHVTLTEWPWVSDRAVVEYYIRPAITGVNSTSDIEEWSSCIT